MNEEKRQTGRTTGLLLEALGQAIQHPNPGYSVFVDHEGGATNWTEIRNIVPKLEKLIKQLGLQGIEFQEGKHEIRITSNLGCPDGTVEAAFRILEAHCAREPSSAKEIEERLEELVSVMTKILKED